MSIIAYTSTKIGQVPNTTPLKIHKYDANIQKNGKTKLSQVTTHITITKATK
jgi:hypothetical protein